MNNIIEVDFDFLDGVASYINVDNIVSVKLCKTAGALDPNMDIPGIVNSKKKGESYYGGIYVYYVGDGPPDAFYFKKPCNFIKARRRLLEFMHNIQKAGSNDAKQSNFIARIGKKIKRTKNNLFARFFA